MEDEQRDKQHEHKHHGFTQEIYLEIRKNLKGITRVIVD